MTEEPVLRVVGIQKRFPGVQALNWGPNDEIAIHAGEIVGLVGENGAGKSTLVQIIAGIYEPSDGQIWLGGQPYTAENAVEAREKGVAIVMQEPALLPTVTVADNIFIGKESTYRNGVGLLSLGKRNALAQRALTDFGLVDIRASKVVQDLNYEQRKLVELVKATFQRPKVLIIDETAAALSLGGQKILFEHIRQLKAEGVATIYITHHLEEILQICDRVVVMKDGQLVADLPVQSTSVDEMSTLMVGRELRAGYFRTDDQATAGDSVALSVEDLSVDEAIEGISFEVHQGEILGIGGLVGAGAQEIGRAIFGDVKTRSGVIRKNGQIVKITSPAEAVKLKIGYVPKDRDKEGLILRNSIRRNIALPILEQLRNVLVLDLNKERRITQEFFQSLRIKAPNVLTLCLNLSGGNRQKVVLAKWLAAYSDVLVLNNPTRGVDVGAKAEIYRLMMDLKQQGLAILMISEELPELIGMSDRILIIRKGRISGEFSRSSRPSEEEIIQYMI